MKKSHQLPGVLPILAWTVFIALLAGCGHEEGSRVPNQPPSVQITGGPMSGSVAEYTARVFWTGWDEDGIVTNYQYAVDPPIEAFSDSMIGYPENFPDISISVIPGPSDRQDTLVVSRSVDGRTYSFRWIETIAFNRSFAFETPEADSSYSGGLEKGPTDTFSGLHTVYVRAADNDGAFSKSDRIGYRAFTITPTATIARPDIVSPLLTIGSTVTVTWDGLDPDSPDARKKPTGYLYKLLRLDTLTPPISVIRVTDPNILYTRGDPTWTYQRADTLSKTLYLATPGQYVFGVRAVDLAGGVEPFLDFGRNVFKFQTFATAGSPTLTIREPSLGAFTYAGVGASYEVEVPVGSDLRFTWSASAEAYGGSIEGYSWGIDIPDLERDGPSSGWSGWGQILGNFQPITFTRGGVHVLTVRVRDVSGTITLGTLILNVIDFPLDREALFVDDSRDSQYPSDLQHDAFWMSLFQDSDRFDMETDVFKYETHGASDSYTTYPQAPSLEQMGRYRLIKWEVAGGGYNGRTGLLLVASINRTLGAYLGAGGKVWIGGNSTLPPMLTSPNGQFADFVYPKDVTSQPNSFAYEFMKLASARIINAKGVPPDDNMIGAKPFPGRPEIYPQLAQDPAKVSPFKLSISHVDAVVDPIYVQDAGYAGTIDSLYVYQARRGGSSYNNKLVAIRWHDPDPARTHGRTQWFGFPLYFIKKDQAQETFNRAIDWFREEQSPNATP